MDLQTLTLQLPDTAYQRLVELAIQSERPLAEEAAHYLSSVLTADAVLAADIEQQFEQLSSLTDDELWQAAMLEATEEENKLMQNLLEKRQREGIDSSESEQIQQLSNRFNQVMMVRAKSAAILAQRGHDISVLAPSS